MSMWKHVAGGLAAGLGQGMVEQAKQTGAMKRDAALARLRSQERLQDREWSIEDQQRQAQMDAAAATRARETELADRQDERAYEERQAETEFERDQRMARLEASLRAPSNPTAGNVYDTVVGDNGNLWAINRDGTTRDLGIKPKPGTTDDSRTAYEREVEYLAQAIASKRGEGEAVTAEDRMEAARLRRSGDQKDEQTKYGLAETFFNAMQEDRRDRRPLAEQWAEAQQLAGLPNGEGPGAPTGLGGGMPPPTEPAAGGSVAAPAPSAPATPAARPPMTERSADRGEPTAGRPAASAAPAMPQPKTMEEFEALPSGTTFMAPDGTVRVKP